MSKPALNTSKHDDQNGSKDRLNNCNQMNNAKLTNKQWTNQKTDKKHLLHAQAVTLSKSPQQTQITMIVNHWVSLCPTTSELFSTKTSPKIDK